MDKYWGSEVGIERLDKEMDEYWAQEAQEDGKADGS
jgi:hypothetical protein